MKTYFLIAIVTIMSALPGCAVPTSAVGPVRPPGWILPLPPTMRPFRSEAELAAYLRELAEQQKREQSRRAKENQSATGLFTAEAPASIAARAAEESVTNTQHAGVDEGGIVKLHGDHLVVLRRGRLFTVKVGSGALEPISAIDAFGPDIDPAGTWYDEMLVSEDTIAVIGYSYSRGGTEVGLFNIDRAGRLGYRSTYHLRSNDYYSSRNYASRLVGNKLIFYTPLYLNPNAASPFDGFPAVRKWHKGAKAEEFQRIVAATHVYRSERPLRVVQSLALHTVTTCDLSGGEFKCEATAVLGPMGRVFYVSPEAVYVWATDWSWREGQSRTASQVFRMPLDGSGPAALGVSGSPIDQFSFLESDDDYLNVLVRSEGSGDGMWHAEGTGGDIALMRVPISTFSDGSTSAPSSSYRRLLKPEGYTFQNRFVGDYLLYGTGSGWGPAQNKQSASLYALRWADGNVHQLTLEHGVDRIEQMGSAAVVVGTDGKDLHFTAIRLDENPEVAGRYTRKGASQGELRSHGFFYKPDGPNSGTLGLPISVPGRPGYRHLFEDSAALLFLRNDSLEFTEVGELAARPERATDDACRASCVDWYGNARPLFVRGRVLALLGYEIVEGSLREDRLRELRRINYAPRKAEITRGVE
ncbi:MAG: hypothetical protein QOE77_3654 [Blastocatellia bacterium]|jgi:hypothetical protein|nr:hypothetical protein [Blastocatellia bacterium]